MRFPASVAACFALQVFILCGAVGAESPLHAQVSLSPAPSPVPVSSDFDTFMGSLARRTHTTFVFEGRPYRSRVPAESPWETATGKGLQQNAATLTAADAAPRVAEIYDYDLSVEKGIYRFRKKFTHTEDLPDVGFDECLLAFEDIQKAVKRFAPAFRPWAMADLRQSLSDEQFAALLSANGLPVCQLEGEARNILWQETLRRNLPLDNTRIVLMSLKSARQDSTVFLWQEAYGHRVFGFQKLVAGTMRPGFLSGLDQVVTRHGVNIITERTGPDRKVIPEVYPSDPAGATPKDYDAAGNPLPLPLEASQNTGTLGKLAVTLTQTQTQKQSSGPPLAISPELTGKTVTVFGGDNADPVQVFTAAAAVCGLTVRTAVGTGPGTQTGKTLLLSRLPVRTAGRATEVSESVLRSLPDSLMRYYGGSVGSATTLREAEIRKTWPLSATPENDAHLRDFARAFAGRRAEAEMHRALLRRLRVLTEPKVAAAKTGRVPFKDLGEEEHSLLALLSAVDCLQDILGFSAVPLTPLLTGSFEDVVVQGSLLPLARGGTDQGLLVLQVGLREKDGFKSHLQLVGTLTPPKNVTQKP